MRVSEHKRSIVASYVDSGVEFILMFDSRKRSVRGLGRTVQREMCMRLQMGEYSTIDDKGAIGYVFENVRIRCFVPWPAIYSLHCRSGGNEIGMAWPDSFPDGKVPNVPECLRGARRARPMKRLTLIKGDL